MSVTPDIKRRVNEAIFMQHVTATGVWVGGGGGGVGGCWHVQDSPPVINANEKEEVSERWEEKTKY